MSRDEKQSKKKKQKVELNALLPLATYDDDEEEEEEEKKNGNRQQQEEEDEEEENGFGGKGGRRNRTIEVRRDCPYLDTVNRQVLDFDFEKFCSVSLSNLNVYACLVCGKYFQGRGHNSHAYTHSLEAGHHVYINLRTEKVYCLPDGYEINDPSLDDIRHLLNPRRITQGEVMAALRKMGRAKAVGLDNIPIEVWKCLGQEGVQWLTNLFNLIFNSGRMPDQWRSSIVVPLYKNKGDAQCCGSYRGIKLLSHTMKLWERVIETRLRRETQVTVNQFGFMPGRSTTEAIHILRRLMEKYREKNRDLHMVFIDLEKAYDSVPRRLIWDSLEDRGVPSKYVDLIKDMYVETKTSVRAPVGDTDFFPVEVGLH
ncbi:putative RNA-directed DNA polymerase [Helianthus annuus]|uniref:RNA-directed DNA polymerase n=1 Tax=Helianthus annuus TaxID=4232 RepID=A0A9K3IY04_HELAN|nr:putative RNA-directed DNA polymerase [Helianthus annuus]KAJ0583023.1 putative RNA-directed DNA polymerase [Helianthus annuus]KAJ0917140.1 putative RNA-directed DNA polymerase [Helianthus annuus]